MKKEIFWTNEAYAHSAPLAGDHTTEILIVGAGIGGVMAAHSLIALGVKPTDITIVECRTVGSGSTGRSAGMLIPELENEKNLSWNTLIATYDEDTVKKYRQAHIFALDMLESLIHTQKIACGAERQDLLILARGDAAAERVKADAAARESIGEHPLILEKDTLREELRSPRFTLAEKSGHGLSVNPLALVQGLTTYLRNAGVTIYEHTPVMAIEPGEATTPQGVIYYKKILCASGLGTTHPAIHRYVTTAAVTEPLSNEVLSRIGLQDHDMFFDDEGEETFHYGKVTADNRLLVGYGDEFSKTTTAEVEVHMPHVEGIQKFLLSAFPEVELPLAYIWSGGYAITAELFPLVEIKDDYIELNGGGIQLSTIVAGQYAAAKLLGREHSLDSMWAKRQQKILVPTH